MKEQWANLTTIQRTEVILKHCKNGTSSREMIEAISRAGFGKPSKGSLVGHVHRNMDGKIKIVATYNQKQPCRPKDQNTQAKSKPARKPATNSTPKAKKGNPDKAVKHPRSRNLSLLELTDSTCRYPHGERGVGKGIRFCGVPKDPFDKSPYCDYHAQLVKREVKYGKRTSALRQRKRSKYAIK